MSTITVIRRRYHRKLCVKNIQHYRQILTRKIENRIEKEEENDEITRQHNTLYTVSKSDRFRGENFPERKFANTSHSSDPNPKTKHDVALPTNTTRNFPRRISSRSLSRTSPVKASHPATAHLLRVTAPRKNFVHTESAIPRWGAVWVWARRANENSCLVYVYHHLTDCVVVLAAPVTCM